jgi:leader peptidase (prepilin peptidase)/N-methyltransferase
VLQLLVALYVALFGLIVGSYLNVVVYRLPLGLSTVRPRSRCPGCGSLIRARDNVPVLSFLVLRGRCRTCGTPISWRYPLVEATAGALFVACLLRFGLAPQFLVAVVFACLMLVLGLIDYDHMILPDRITLPGIAVGLATQLAAPLAGLIPAVIGTLLGAGILLAVWALWWVVRREEGMGLGDVKMLALAGAFLGWSGVLVTLFFAALTGSVVGLALMRWGSLDMRSKLPFGVFLALGGVVALFFGDALVSWYAGLL